MKRQPYPILEFDADSPPVINPSDLRHPPGILPGRCVLCFFPEVIAKVTADAEIAYMLQGEYGMKPVHVLECGGERVVVAHPGVGASLAAMFLEVIIHMGADRFIACGGAGVLEREIAVGHVILPDSAVRDEGTSYHYLPPGREVAPSPGAVAALEAVLDARGVPYIKGKTWTTDALLRETRDKIKARRAEGCVAVEMEAAAFFAVAAYRGVTFGQMLYGGDDVSGGESGAEAWDHRGWKDQIDVREALFEMALEAVLQL